MPHDIAEVPQATRQRNLSYYLVLLCLVAPLWTSVPLSWAFVIYALRSGKIWYFAWPGRLFFAVTLCEVFFSIYHYHLCQRISGPPPYGPGELLEIQAAYRRLLKAGLANLPQEGDDEESKRSGSPEETILQLERDDPRAIDFRNCLRTWFCKVPWSSVRLHEVRQWLYWSIFNTDLPPAESISDSHQIILDEALDLLQKRSGSIIPAGSDSTIKPMRLTIDNVNIMWRPLTYYALVWLFNWCHKQRYENKWNARHGFYHGLEYLIRIPKHWDNLTGPRPIVFIHGLGLGLLQYNHVFSHLFETFTDRPLLILLQPQISQDIFHPRFLKPMSRHHAADRLAGLISKLGWVQPDAGVDEGTSEDSEEEASTSLHGKKTLGVTMLSHSNGSYTHAWMLKGHPKMISRSCFVDPVTFCSWEGDVCYNFIYRPCRTGIELVMRYFVSCELGVANLLQRHFDWVSNSLWYDEIPNARDPYKTFFVLGGKDDIVHSERVKRYLTSHGVGKGLWYDPEAIHGQALASGSPGYREIVRWLQEPDILSQK